MKCACIDDLEALSDYADRWEELRHRCHGSVFTSYPLIRTWLESFSNVASPRILIAEEAGEVIGIAPFVLRSQRVAAIPIKLLTLAGDADWRLGLSSLNVLLEPERSDVSSQLVTALRSMDWNILRLRFMEDSPAARDFIDLARSNWVGPLTQPSTTLTCTIPGSGDILGNFGRNYRKNIHQRLRRIERDSVLEFRSVPEADIDRAVDIYARQHIERWQTRGGSILRNPDNADFMRATSRLAISKGFGYAYELVIDGQVAAQRFGFFEGGTAWAYMVGMNDDFARYSPGLILLYYVLGDLRERGIKCLNLGEGAQEHKYHMGVQESSLIGMQAERGLISTISRIAKHPLAQHMESAMGIRRKLLGDGNGFR